MPPPEIRFWGFGTLFGAYALAFLYRYLSYGLLSLTEAVIWGLLLLFPLSLSIEALQEANGIRRLRAGRDVIARWVVSASDWESFMDFDSVRSGRYANFTSIRRVRRGHPVEVIFGHRDVMVDGRWYKLQGRVGAVFHVAWIEVEPACLEIAILGGADPLSFGVLRVPVPEAAVAKGRRVYDHFKAQIPFTAEPPKILFGYDRAEGVAERYVSSAAPARSASTGNVRAVIVGGAFFALVGIGIAIVAWYQGTGGAMDPGGADLLIITGIITAGASLGGAALLYAKALRDMG